VILPLALKKKIAAALLHDTPPILCASIGRVGSTMLRHALGSERRMLRFGPFRSVPRTLLYEPVWELKNARFRPGAIHFTHDFPHELVAPSCLKVVFLYGRPSDTILSLVRRHDDFGPEWMNRHFAHMHASGPYKEILQRDVLRIGEQIDAWPTVHSANVLGLRYAALWENVEKLSEFVGFRVSLPERIERKFLDINPAIVAMVRENYRELDHLEAQLPDYFFTQPARNGSAAPTPCLA
jgi:hypothetical protein